MSTRNSAIVFSTMLLLIFAAFPLAGHEMRIASAQISPELPSYIELGFSPSTLSSVQEGIPVFSPGDSLWLLSTSNQIISARLASPTGSSFATIAISATTVSEIYTFSASSSEGNWDLDLSFRNSSVLSIPIPFVNPSNHPVAASLSNYSIEAGQLNLGITISEVSSAFDFEDCLASPDINSTMALQIPGSMGDGEILLSGNLHSAKLSISGETYQSFSFWYDLEYSYAFAGNVTGELVSRDIAAISSSTAVFSTSTTATVSLTNNTTPRLGRYEVEGFFDSGTSLQVEKTSALLLANGNWLWIGGCGPAEISSLSFSLNASLTQGPRSWPTNLYLMYSVEGVDSYSSLPLNLSPARVDFLSTMGNETLPYLGFNVGPNPAVLASGGYDGSLYLIGKSFPLTIGVTPTFGNESLGSQTVTINSAFSAALVQIPVGTFSATVTNNSAPISGATVSAQNSFGGNASASTDSAGVATLYLPQGSYIVSAASGTSSLSEDANVSIGSLTVLHFSFTTTAQVNYVEDLLVSLLVVGIAINAWLWLKPKRNIY